MLRVLIEKISDNDYSQSKRGIAYKVFEFRNNKLYPPMVANVGNNSTPTDVWLDAEPGEFVEINGLQRVVQRGANRDKLIQRINNLDNLSPEDRKKELKNITGSTLAYRPGWHLGDEPIAPQFNKGLSWKIVDKLPDGAVVADKSATSESTIPNAATKANLGKYVLIKDSGKYAYIFGDPNPKNRKFFPYNFIWAECEYLMDIEYQEEAHQAGVNERQVSYKLLPDVVMDNNDLEYQVLQFKQGTNLFYVTFNGLDDIRIDDYPFDDLESAFEKKDYVQKEVQNYFLQDNMDIIEDVIESGSNKGKETMRVFSHISGDIKHLPTGGYYKYRTNPDPDTIPWVITGSIKVTKLLDDFDVAKITGGRAPERQGGNKTLSELGLTQI